ncbi:MAG: M20/M25/M40 family metallo-hydrolase [Acidobacteria bacterium]|nr:M20/M25/M40 family metallo-hydrolase [Acidobacteriota bacterium]
MTSVQHVMRLLRERGVFGSIDARSAEATVEQRAICEIAAPPFGEGPRANYLLDRFAALGLSRVTMDGEGNVLAVIPAGTQAPAVVICAHLDTVFPPETDVRVVIGGGRLRAPGISDNASGLTAMLAIARAMVEHGLKPEATLLFLCSVGEEAHGNLRGVRYFFRESEWTRGLGIGAFIALDGHGLDRIVNRALGSRRFRVKIAGPGGHSWGDFGIVNPIHVLGHLVVQLARYPGRDHPRSALNVAAIRGGRSVNAIPQDASVDIDLRSTDEKEIVRLEDYVRRSVEASVRREVLRAGGSADLLQTEIELLGERPAGCLDARTALLRTAIEASRAMGIEPAMESASTDANIPISLGIPALALGSGGIAGGIHTLEEWYDPSSRETGIKRARVTALAMTGLKA